MPYNSREELPESVRKVLPKHVQDIFKDAFNNAFKQYKNEATAFMVAWSAVKKKYKKVDGKWAEI